ncbi:MAG TPA: SURF1 family protein [Paracoccus sp. (in: a-proteobacteria)]|nr:SURF1 family protein [Paracoccus sp. (in: a-proteobacteria)]
MRRIIGPLILGLVGCAILISLGVWQLRRAEWKDAMLAGIQRGIEAAPGPLPAQVDPSMKYRPVTVAGQTTGREILVLSGTREMGGGYNVVSGFVTGDGRRIMVDRGFIPADDRRKPRLPARLAVEGNLHWPAEKGSATPEPNLAEGIWFARDVPAMAAQLDTEPVLVVARSVSGEDQGVMPLPLSPAGIPNNHLSYAVQWFMMAAVWAGMTVALIWRIRQRRF